MERYGLVHFEAGKSREVAPRVNYSGVELEMSFWMTPANSFLTNPAQQSAHGGDADQIGFRQTQRAR